jgi:hypothetical protein
MLFRETTAVYRKKHIKDSNTFIGQNEEFSKQMVCRKPLVLKELI